MSCEETKKGSSTSLRENEDLYADGMKSMVQQQAGRDHESRPRVTLPLRHKFNSLSSICRAATRKQTPSTWKSTALEILFSCYRKLPSCCPEIYTSKWDDNVFLVQC